jgi:hypothetical protein
MIVFGSQRPIYYEANHTHSFALFVRAVTDEDCRPHVVESFPISWLPQSMEVRVGRLHPEPGWNLDIPRTLDWALKDGQRVSRWGPFQVTPELYQRALRQKNHLESGAVRYKTLDTGFPTRHVSNCIHALADIHHEAPRLRLGTPTWGQAGSYFITLSLGRFIVDPRVTHEWVIDAVGLRDCPIVARHLDDRNPTLRPVLRAGQSMLRIGFRQSLRRDSHPN